MTKKQKKALLRILAAAVLFAAGLLIPARLSYVRLGVFIAAYLCVGIDVLREAVEHILHGQVFDENFLMGLATLGAWAIGEYPEAVSVMLFYQIGELFQSYAVGKSRRSIAELMDIRPDKATVVRAGAELVVDPETVAVGETVVVRPGEKIPLDGIVLEGSSSLNTAALTGESAPRDVEKGDSVVSGCINTNGVLRIRTTRAFGESTVSKILDLVENASSQKARTENFITRFARIYTPAVVGAAVLLAVLPPLFLGGGWSAWIRRALIFLVISCPCALVISVPLSFFGGIGGASRRGVLVKGSNYLEALARTDTVVFDKTGTLTKGTFQVTAVHPEKMPEKELLRIAAFAEGYSDHPISQSLKAAYKGELDPRRVERVNEIAGQGVSAMVDKRRVLVGNVKLMAANEVALPPEDDCRGTVIHVAVDGVYAGHILISDQLKEQSRGAVAALKREGVRRTVMLTGDSDAVAAKVAQQLGLDEYHAGLLPQDKVARVESMLAEPDRQGRLAFVGDGINDAPVLARADVGIAMGALGSDAAIEAADIVLMNDDPADIALAMRIAKKTLTIVLKNIVFALGVKLLVLVLGALGAATMWEAVFADVGVSVIAILNAMRAMRTPG